MAQYYIGWIHYSQSDFPSAMNDFDAVLEKYPDNNNKMADAFYYKGLTLVKMKAAHGGVPGIYRALSRASSTNSLAPPGMQPTEGHGQALPHRWNACPGP